MKDNPPYIPAVFETCRDLALQAHSAGIDLEMLARNLTLSATERLLELQKTLEAIEILHSARRVR